MIVLQPLLLGIASFLLSFALAPTFVKLCKKLNILDTVNHRSSHTETTPRGGGLLIVFVFYVFLGCSLLFTSHYTQFNAFEKVFLLCSIPVAILGFVDDRFSIKPTVRLLLQLCATGLPIFIYRQHHLHSYSITACIILTLAWAWFLNLYNFMDGTDGYAAMEGIAIAIGIMIIAGWFFNEMAILIGALLGFFRVNFPKAKLFLGDIGSTFLGYLLGGYLIYAFLQAPQKGMLLFAITLLFSLDATYTLIKRVLKGQKPWEAHREHWYQRLIILGFSHRWVLGWGVCLNLWALGWVACIALFFRGEAAEIYWVAFLPYLASGLLIKYWEHANQKIEAQTTH